MFFTLGQRPVSYVGKGRGGEREREREKEK
jgi:hypothetical protein